MRLRVFVFALMATGAMLFSSPTLGSEAPSEPNGVARLLGQLRSADSSDRMRALFELKKRPPEQTEAAIPALIEVLETGNAWNRELAIEALGRYGPKAAPALPALVQVLKTEQQALVEDAGWAIARVDPKGAGDVPNLLRQLCSSKEDDRLRAAQHLAHICAESRYVRNPEVDLDPIVAGLRAALADESKAVRRGVLIVLKNAGRAAREAAPAVARLADDRDSALRRQVVEVLRAIADAEGVALETVIRATRDADAGVRERALEAIWDWCSPYGSMVESVMPVLTRALDDEEEGVRYFAILALGKIGDRAAPAVPRLCELMAERDSGLASTVIPEALGKIIGRNLRRYSGSVRSIEDAAGGYVDPVAEKEHVTEKEVDLAVDALSAALEPPANERLAESVTKALAQIGPRAKSAAGVLRKALGHTSPRVRANAAMAIEYIGPAAKAALPDLVRALGDDEYDVRDSVVRALYGVARGSAEITPHLAAALEDEDWRVRRLAALALAESDQEAVGLLIPLLASTNAGEAASAAMALGRIGPRASASVPALVEALRHEDEDVRAEAAEAIARIGRATPSAKKALIGIVAPGTGRDAWHALQALAQLRLDQTDAAALADLEMSDLSRLTDDVFVCLFPFPNEALTFLERNPRAIDRSSNPRPLCAIIDRTEKGCVALRKAILAHPELPATVMAWSGDPRFLPVIRERMEKGNRYDRILLSACARACGKPADKVVEISEDQPGGFRPPSASGTGDRRRMPANFTGAHGDGHAIVLVTGHVLMPTGLPAENPRLFDSTNRMLIPEGRRDPLPVRYDPETGRFVFLSQVFAAYAWGSKEPGPYQTGPGLVWIEAEGAKPFRFVFFDEMPEVRITLSPQSDDESEETAEQ